MEIFNVRKATDWAGEMFTSAGGQRGVLQNLHKYRARKINTALAYD